MSFRPLFFAGALALACITSFTGASAESRVALVIGNSAYQSVPALPNPANDAKAMVELLKAANFEVLSAHDLGQAEMRRALGDFARRAAGKGPDTVALIYYAGHGVQVDGDNYLVPVDAQIHQEADVPMQTVRLADVMNVLAAVPSKMRIVMLDACRNNPFSDIGRSGGRGLAIVDAPNGSIVSYSTAPGSEAEDGGGHNSPYTSAVLAVAREPGLPIEQAFKRVRYAVHQQTDGRQTPWESSSLTGDFSFFPGDTQTTGTGVPGSSTQVASLGPGTAPRPVDDWRETLKVMSAQEAYRVVIREDTPEVYETYLELFTSDPLAQRVRSLLDRRAELIAWHNAVTINTGASFRAFLAAYPNSDYAATAQKLVERTGRSLAARERERVCVPTVRRRADLGRPDGLAGFRAAGPAGAEFGSVQIGGVAPLLPLPTIAALPPALSLPRAPLAVGVVRAVPAVLSPVVVGKTSPVIDTPRSGSEKASSATGERKRPLSERRSALETPAVTSRKVVLTKRTSVDAVRSAGRPITMRTMGAQPAMSPRPMIGAARAVPAMGARPMMGGGGLRFSPGFGRGMLR